MYIISQSLLVEGNTDYMDEWIHGLLERHKEELATSSKLAGCRETPSETSPVVLHRSRSYSGWHLVSCHVIPLQPLSLAGSGTVSHTQVDPLYSAPVLSRDCSVSYPDYHGVTPRVPQLALALCLAPNRLKYCIFYGCFGSAPIALKCPTHVAIHAGFYCYDNASILFSLRYAD